MANTLIQSGELLTTRALLRVDIYRDDSGHVYAHLYGDIVPLVRQKKPGEPVPVMVTVRFEDRLEADNLKSLSSEIDDVVELNADALGVVTRKFTMRL